MSDLISRQDTVDIINGYAEQFNGYIGTPNDSEVYAYARGLLLSIERNISALPSAQPEIEERMSETEQNVPNDDFISRKRAIDALMEDFKRIPTNAIRAKTVIEQLPSVQPTLCGYDIDHLMLIAAVLRKENLPPERVTEALTDIGRIVSIVRNEFEESLRKAVEQCKDGGVSRNDA